MNALVLGGNGFIGSHVVDALVDSGASVRVLDRLPEKYRPRLKGVDYRMVGLEDRSAVAEALDSIDIVFHFACTTVPSTSNIDPVADIESNLIGSVRLIQDMLDKGVNRIVFLSSGGTVYGNPTSIPIQEDHPLHPICSYGITKAAVEKYLYMFQELHGLRPIILRPSNVYGPRQGHIGVQGVIAAFINNISKNEPLRVWGDGSLVRDYLYVKDLACLCLIAGTSDECGIFNAGSGKGYSINSLLEILTKITGQKLRVDYEPSRAYDVKEVVLDTTKTLNSFNWSPEVDITEGIKSHWNWFRNIMDTPDAT